MAGGRHVARQDKRVGVLIVVRDLGLKLISIHLVGDHTTDAMRPRRNVHSDMAVAPEETPNAR
jgi:hypothetical protein